ncbi:GNAT family N-acetyltransferase [Vibrio chagasii]|uniref:GNAT family N-acetyltransferase n=1 Tax=Vibrio chagasii TaxID=170679 RepID=UPI001EFCABE7|nr:GNAT family N-acetyltransferase [Vibrio chagasii]MCG9671948.1 GNAT family N-acetyltransferase [Vibrio chagasii]
MEVQLIEIKEQERKVLENLFSYYIYDMTEYMKWSPNNEGKFSYDTSQFDVYWEREDHISYFIYVDAELAGFVLVRRYPSDLSIYDIEQFFVLRKFKGQGVGKEALAQVVSVFTGKWQIRVLLENSAALYFWKSAVSRIVGDKFRVTKANDVDLLMFFIHFESNGY